MPPGDAIPDAWDDDYEAIVDAKPTSSKNPQPEPKLSRAERKARHEEANKQLWESAEKQETFHFVEATKPLPPTSDFKPALKVLSRKPQTQSQASKDVTGGVKDMSLMDDEDDSEEEARKAQERSLAERQRKAAQEREEKQRKYAEARARLFGDSNQTPDGRNSPTRPTDSKSRARGNQRKSGGNSRASQSISSAEGSPGRPTASSRQLYDPNEPSGPRPSVLERLGEGANPTQEKPIRSPRGPDGSGRGGFGFSPRGNKTNVT